jgi:GTP-binding protein Era
LILGGFVDTPDKLDEVLDGLPEPVQQQAAERWAALPPAVQEDLGTALDGLPSSLKPLKEILSLVADQYKPVYGNKRRIAVVGPANVGKSTLYNRLVARREDEAAVSPVPGTTRRNQEADAGLFLVVDTPGADAVGAVGQREREIAFRAADAADFLVIVLDVAHGIKQDDKALVDDLVALDKPYVLVLNKIDLVPKKHREEVIEAAAASLGVAPGRVVDTVATEGTHVGRVVLAVARAEPELLAALARALPEYRSRLAWQRILSAASGAGVVGLTPLPFADLIPLWGIQTGLVLSLARVYGYRITAGRAKELIATFGIGFLGRTLFYELVKLGGVPGWILGASVAAATTVTLGYGAMIWFAHGEQPTAEALRRIAGEVAGILRDRLLDLGKKKPDKRTLRQRLAEGLQDLPERLRRESEGAEA